MTEQLKVAAVNHNKELEEILLRLCDKLKTEATIDQRWLAIGRTHFEQGFMALNRSISKPGRVRLPVDDAPEPTMSLTPQDDGDRSQDLSQANRDRTNARLPNAPPQPAPAGKIWDESKREYVPAETRPGVEQLAQTALEEGKRSDFVA